MSMHSTPRRRACGLATLLLSTASVIACAPTRGAAFERSLAEARRSHHDGRFEAAANAFDQAAREAKIPRDAVYARYEAALARARAGDIARASAELRAIATAKPQSAYSAQAAFKAAELAQRSDETRGLAEMERVILDFPDDGVAQVALARIVTHDDETGGAERALARLDALLPKIHGKKVEEKAAYERARHLDTLGKTEAARDAYVDVANRFPYPFGAFNDDALFRAGQMEVSLKHFREAIGLYERLLAQREVAGFIGSYERPRYVPALLEIARIHESELHDRAAARAALHRLYADFTTSTMRDDALWREAELWRKDGDTKSACARLATLSDDFPDSRYVPCVSVRCPAVPRPKASKAPTTCHAYLLRDGGT